MFCVCCKQGNAWREHEPPENNGPPGWPVCLRWRRGEIRRVSCAFAGISHKDCHVDGFGYSHGSEARDRRPHRELATPD